MTLEQRERYLAGQHVGVLAVAREEGPPGDGPPLPRGDDLAAYLGAIEPAGIVELRMQPRRWFAVDEST